MNKFKNFLIDKEEYLNQDSVNEGFEMKVEEAFDKWIKNMLAEQYEDIEKHCEELKGDFDKIGDAKNYDGFTTEYEIEKEFIRSINEVYEAVIKEVENEVEEEMKNEGLMKKPDEIEIQTN
uniref:Uncharacterized protein n=1 Tax=Meloidogyne hapla TaxID=6305 RepID=A0A1I8BYS8_MELHA